MPSGAPARKWEMSRKHLTNLAFGLVFLAGLCLLLYPLVSNVWNDARMSQLVSGYDADVAEVSQEDNSRWFDAAEAYNKTLEGKGVPDAFALVAPEESAAYETQLAFRDDGMMGYLEVPRIGQTLPIYHGTSEATLARGVGHLVGSALPVGGASTHCVLSAHRGLPSASLFTDLDKLALGDHFYIHVLDRTLAYEVDQILTVEPDDTSALDVEEGADLVTLVTCTPYGVNTQRLLVRGHRVELAAGAAAAETPAASLTTNYLLWVVLGLLAVAAFVAVASRRLRKDARPLLVVGDKRGRQAVADCQQRSGRRDLQAIGDSYGRQTVVNRQQTAGEKHAGEKHVPPHRGRGRHAR